MGNTWKVVLATVLIFAAGVVTGGLLVRQSATRPWQRLERQQPPPRQSFSPGNMRLEFLRRAHRELDLTPEQRGRIDAILSKSQERSRKVMESVAPKLREEVQRTREELQEVLTPPQRAQFDRLLKQQQRPRDHKAPGREGPRERPSGPNQPRLPEGNAPVPEPPPARS